MINLERKNTVVKKNTGQNISTAGALENDSQYVPSVEDKSPEFSNHTAENQKSEENKTIKMNKISSSNRSDSISGIETVSPSPQERSELNIVVMEEKDDKSVLLEQAEEYEMTSQEEPNSADDDITPSEEDEMSILDRIEIEELIQGETERMK